jgi:hypothetical protein
MSEQKTIAELAPEDLETLVRKMKKGRDSYAAMNEMEPYVGWGDRKKLLWHLTREGLLDTWNEPQLWSELVDGYEHASAEDVAMFLTKVEAYDKAAEDDGSGADAGYEGYDDGYYDQGYYEEPSQPAYESQRLVDFWPSTLDNLTMVAYAENPAAFEPHIESFSEPVQKGFQLVLRRFGAIGRDGLPDGVVDALASQQVNGGGLPWSVQVVRDGEPVELTIGDAKTSKEEFFGFIELFGSVDDWAETVLEASLAAEYAPSFDLSEDAWPVANLDQLTELLAGTSLHNQAAQKVYAILLDERDDSPEELFEVARVLVEVHSQDSQSEICATAAILKCKRAGEDVPDGAESLLNLRSPGSPTKRHDFKVLEPIIEALRYLPEDRRVARLLEIFEGQYTGNYAFKGLQAAPDDEQLWEAAFAEAEERASGDSAGFSALNSVANGLALVGQSGLPRLEAAYDATDNAVLRDGYQRTIIYTLADMVEAGEELPERCDRFVNYVGWEEVYLAGHNFGNYVAADLNKVVAALPEARAEALLLEQLDPDKALWARVFEALPHCPTDKLFDQAFSLLEAHGLPPAEGNFKWLERMLRALGDEAGAHVGHALANSDSAELHNSVKNVLGEQTYEKMLADVGAQSAADKSKADKIERLSNAYFDEHEGAKRTKLYFFERLEEEPEATDLNRLGGRPIGVDAGSWPLKGGDEDQPMEHMYTLDMATVPGLQSRVGEGVRAVSLFVYNPSYNEAWTAYNSDTEVVLLTEDDVAKGPFEGDLPVGDASGARKFSVQEAEVPAEIFLEVHWDEERDPQLEEIRNGVYQSNAWGGGQPIWLQGDEGAGPDFVMQFDEGFVYMNLGDSGVMYVYPDTAFWQCH